LVDRNDPVCDIVDPFCDMVARYVIEIGTKDTRDPQEIASRAVKQIGVLL
jgi:hypothetical protein